MWLSYLLHGVGRVWETISNLGKTNFDFWSKKTPKIAFPFSHTPTFFICSPRESLGAIFDLHNLLDVCFLHDFGPRTFSQKLMAYPI